MFHSTGDTNKNKEQTILLSVQNNRDISRDINNYSSEELT